MSSGWKWCRSRLAKDEGISVRRKFLFSPLRAEENQGDIMEEKEAGQHWINCWGNGLLDHKESMERGSIACVRLHLKHKFELRSK